MIRDCEYFKVERKFIQFLLSKEELDFFIVYFMVVYEKIENFERFLRVVYVFQNIYCIYVDEKFLEIFKEVVKVIILCFFNVFLVSKLVRVVYVFWFRVQVDLNCMEDLFRSLVLWKYFLNICGIDFFIKINVEMVLVFKMLNGKNSMELEIFIEYKKFRWKYYYEVIDILYRISRMKDFFFDNLFMFIGNVYIVVFRSFIEYVLENFKLRQLIEWVKDIYSFDEYFWVIFQRVLWMFGFVFYYFKFYILDMIVIVRLVKWQGYEGNISMGVFYEFCFGIYQRVICIYGIGDLFWIFQNYYLLVNKFDLKVDDNVFQCLEEYLRYKVVYGIEF